MAIKVLVYLNQSDDTNIKKNAKTTWSSKYYSYVVGVRTSLEYISYALIYRLKKL